MKLKGRGCKLEPAQKPPVQYIGRINVALEDRTSWNLRQGDWTREKFLEALKRHSWIKVGERALVNIPRIVDVKFYGKDGTLESCAEFEFA